METIIMELDEKRMKHMIMDLLCLGDDSEWISQTCTSKLVMKFKGNIYKVQEEIYDWLNVEERKHNFRLLANPDDQLTSKDLSDSMYRHL